MTKGNILDRDLVHAGGALVPVQGTGVPEVDLEDVHIQSQGAGDDHGVRDEEDLVQGSEGDLEVYQSQGKKRKKRRKDPKPPRKATAQPGDHAAPAETESESEKENEDVEEVDQLPDLQRSQDHPSANSRGHHLLEGIRKKRRRTKTGTEAVK